MTEQEVAGIKQALAESPHSRLKSLRLFKMKVAFGELRSYAVELYRDELDSGNVFMDDNQNLDETNVRWEQDKHFILLSHFRISTIVAPFFELSLKKRLDSWLADDIIEIEYRSGNTKVPWCFISHDDTEMIREIKHDMDETKRWWKMGRKEKIWT